MGDNIKKINNYSITKILRGIYELFYVFHRAV